MSLSTMLDSLKKTLPRGERVYAEARTRQSALAPYENIGALRAAIDRGSRLSLEERDAILAAIVTELRLAPSGLWQSLLLVTFTPMLVGLRSALRRPDSEDLDQRVLLAFLDTARSLSARTFVARALRLATRKRVFTEQHRERRTPDLELFDEETHPADTFRVEAHERAAAAEIVRIIEAEGGEELREVLLSSADDESVKEYVDRAYAGCDERVRARASKRLRRARLEVFSRLRQRAARREHVAARAA